MDGESGMGLLTNREEEPLPVSSSPIWNPILPRITSRAVSKALPQALPGLFPVHWSLFLLPSAILSPVTSAPKPPVGLGLDVWKDNPWSLKHLPNFFKGKQPQPISLLSLAIPLPIHLLQKWNQYCHPLHSWSEQRAVPMLGILREQSHKNQLLMKYSFLKEAWQADPTKPSLLGSKMRQINRERRATRT